MATIITQTVNVELSTGKVIPTAFVHQNDTSRTIIFKVTSNGMPWDLSDCTIKFAYKSPIVDGQYSVIAGNSMVSGEVESEETSWVYFTPTIDYTRISGVGMLTMIITPSSGTIRPVNIRLVVQKSADGDDTVMGASDWPEGLYEYMDDWLAENEPTEIANLKSDLNYNHTAEPGYVLRATDSGHGNEWAMVGTPTDAQAETAINKWLDEHPEATTTVQDGAITEAKFSDALKLKALNNYLTPEMFGAKGDGETDDTLAIADALAEANTSGLPIVGTGIYKASSITINNDNTVMYLKRLVCSGDALTVTSSYNHLEFERVSSTSGNGVVFRNGRYSTLKANVISAAIDAVKLISDNDSVMFNDITAIEVFGAVGIHLDYTNATSANEWVNENIFHVWAFHSPIGVHINGANYPKCNANVFYDMDLELCSTAGILIDGKTQYNKFINVRNEELTSDKVLCKLNGDMRSSIIDCKSEAYATNFVCGSDTTDTRNTPNIITHGLFTQSNIELWTGQVAFATKSGGVPILYPLEKQRQVTLFVTSGELNPRTDNGLSRASALLANGVRSLEISDDYGYNAGSLPDLIVTRDDTLTLTKNGETIATLTNTLTTQYAVIKKVYFISDSRVYVV